MTGTRGIRIKWSRNTSRINNRRSPPPAAAPAPALAPPPSLSSAPAPAPAPAARRASMAAHTPSARQRRDADPQHRRGFCFVGACVRCALSGNYSKPFSARLQLRVGRLCLCGPARPDTAPDRAVCVRRHKPSHCNSASMQPPMTWATAQTPLHDRRRQTLLQRTVQRKREGAARAGAGQRRTLRARRMADSAAPARVQSMALMATSRSAATGRWSDRVLSSRVYDTMRAPLPL
jgi:hypothetical protein